MKQGIHPKYDNVKVTCSCGNTFETKSTTNDITVEICSACHPFYTGKQKLVDTAGRVDKFKTRFEASQKLREEKLKSSIKKVDNDIAEGKVEEAIEELDKDIEEITEELQEETVKNVEDVETVEEVENVDNNEQ